MFVARTTKRATISCLCITFPYGNAESTNAKFNCTPKPYSTTLPPVSKVVTNDTNKTTTTSNPNKK